MFNLSKFIGQYVTKRETSIILPVGGIKKTPEN